MRAPAQDLSLTAATADEPYRAIFEASRDGLIVTDLETGRVVAANAVASAMHGYPRDAFVGLLQTTYLPADSAQRFPDYVSALQTGGVFEGRAVHRRRNGSTFDVNVRLATVAYQGRPCLLSSLRDISQQAQSEHLLAQQVEARTREQSALSAISQALASTLELNPELILDQVRAIVDYTHAGLFVREESDLTALAVREPAGQEPYAPFRVRVSDPEALAALLNEHAPIRIDDVWSETADALFIRSLWREHAAVLLRGVRAWMWLPLAVGGRIIGGISVARPERAFFTAHHADLAQTVANQVAITLVNTQLYKQAQALAALQERQRLARNLHDAVNQSLFSAGLIAEVLPRLWERDPDEGRRSLEDLRRLTRGALAELRALLGELRPSVLTDTDLGDLLRQLGNALTGRADVPVTVTVSGQGNLPAEVRVTLYRLCQEALSNIGKHAEARRVSVGLQYEPGAVELHIQDDGRGFDPDHTPPGHMGLSIMRERAETIGAALIITSRPGEGTEIVARWTDDAEPEAR